jgi:hypothetical protein
MSQGGCQQENSVQILTIDKKATGSTCDKSEAETRSRN